MPGVNYAQRFFALLLLLREETDTEHRMDALAICARLRERNGLEVDPRSVRKTLTEMIEAGLPIDDTHKYCWLGTFLPGELEYLIGSVQFGYGLAEEQRRTMSKKLLSLGDRRAKMEDTFPRRSGNMQMLDTLEILHKAMDSDHQVQFHYGHYNPAGQLLPIPSCIRASGKSKAYNASPYRVVSSNGRFYLIAAVNRHPELSHYRVDRILDIRIRKALRKPQPEDVRIEDYVLRHPYMYSGPVKRYCIRVGVKHLDDVYDWFGGDIRGTVVDRNLAEVHVESDQTSMELWLRRYKEHVVSATLEQENNDD